MIAQIVAKSLIRLLIDEFATQGDFPVVHKASLVSVTFRAVGSALSSIFPQRLD